MILLSTLLQMLIGNAEYHCSCVRYVITSDLVLILALSISLGLLLIIVVIFVIILACYCKRRSEKKREAMREKEPYGPHDSDGDIEDYTWRLSAQNNGNQIKIIFIYITQYTAHGTDEWGDTFCLEIFSIQFYFLFYIIRFKVYFLSHVALLFLL